LINLDFVRGALGRRNILGNVNWIIICMVGVLLYRFIHWKYIFLAFTWSYFCARIQARRFVCFELKLEAIVSGEVHSRCSHMLDYERGGL